MLMKIGHREFDVKNSDVVVFNGCAYICLTLTYRKGWHRLYQSMSKTQAERLIKSGELILVEEHLDYVTDGGREMWRRTYRFDVE